MRKFRYMDENFHLSDVALVWFVRVRSSRLIRQYARTDPGFLAVAYAEAHLGRVATRW